MENSHQNCHQENHVHQEQAQEIIYTCPMHPEIKRDMSGICPECGMNLVLSEKEESGHNGHKKHNKHEGHSTNAFRIKFFGSLILSIPIVVYSDIAQKLIGYQAPIFIGSAYLVFALASVIFFYGGWVFFFLSFW